jgi:hypothetical protein
VTIRTVLVWLALFGVYASTLGLDAFLDSDYGGDEPHYLLGAKSLVDDGDIDLADEYRDRDYLDFYPYELDRHGKLTEGRVHEPHGVGFPVLIAPAFAIGGAKGVELFVAAIAALAVALAYPLALRVVPDPYALGATLAVGLSPPFVAYGTAVYPELTAAALLAGAALLALRLSERPTRGAAFACYALIAPLPWLGAKFLLPGLVIGVFAWRQLVRARRPLLAFLSLEVAAFSTAFYIGVNEGLYGGLTPYAAEAPGETGTDAEFPGGYVERAYRLVALLIDREYGLLRWAPVFALAGVGAWLLYRGRREQLARALPEYGRAQSTALLCCAVIAAQLVVAAFLAPTMFGFWFPPRHLLACLPLAIPLVAWGLRHVPRTGTALAAIGIAASVWLYVAVRSGSGSLATDRPDAPLGPLERLLPLFDDGNPVPYALAGALAAVLAATLLLESRHWRQTAGTTREKYSG